MSDSALAGQEELSTSLSNYLSAHHGQTVEVSGLTRMSDGWESDVYAFDAPAWHAGGHVLRLYFGANAGPTALHEYRSLDLLRRGGYPVPEVVLVEPSMQPLGRSFLVMQRIEGISLGTRWRDPDPGVRQREMARFCELLATLHSLKWAHLPGAEHVPLFTIAQQLATWSAYEAMYPLEALKRGMAWLQEASAGVTAQPLGLVHWDFHHENILVDKADRAWVIDWTQFQATDIRFDLAWTLMLLASQRDLETSQAVRAGYMAVRGWDEAAVEAELNFFEAAACAKRLVSVLLSMGAGADAVGMRPGAEAVMSNHFPRFAVVYKRWLALTATPLPDVETMLAGHL